MTAHCSRCGRKLTNPKSQERGMGPVCCPRPTAQRVRQSGRRGRKPRAKASGQLDLFERMVVS